MIPASLVLGNQRIVDAINSFTIYYENIRKGKVYSKRPATTFSTDRFSKLVPQKGDYDDYLRSKRADFKEPE